MDPEAFKAYVVAHGYDPRAIVPATRLVEALATLGPLIEDVERTKLKQSISRNLKSKPLGKTDYVFLTVNFDPSKSYEECFKAAQKLGNRKIWKWCCWVHEQRSDNVERAGEGHHIHLLARIAAPNAKTRAKSTVCTVCDVKNSAIFHWKYIPEEYLHDKYLYVTDSKALEKQGKQRVDDFWRASKDLLPVYYNGEEACKAQTGNPEAQDATTDG